MESWRKVGRFLSASARLRGSNLGPRADRARVAAARRESQEQLSIRKLLLDPLYLSDIRQESIHAARIEVFTLLRPDVG